jgi:hypothetical protein
LAGWLFKIHTSPAKIGLSGESISSGEILQQP